MQDLVFVALTFGFFALMFILILGLRESLARNALINTIKKMIVRTESKVVRATALTERRYRPRWTFATASRRFGNLLDV